MNFKNWLKVEENSPGMTLSYGANGGQGDIATFTMPIGLVRKDMYATIPNGRKRRRRRRSINRGHSQ
jgi:hypothetical protein